MLEIKNLHSGYGDISVLRGIDISVGKNEIVALIGPNGAGKSTVIKSIYNLATITSGTISYNGKEITSLATHKLLKEGIGYVNQGKIVFDTLSVSENLLIGAQNLDESEQKSRVAHVFEKFPILKERSSQLAFSLSGGQQQQLALARALMQKPSLLLLDEPSIGLSPKLQKELFQTIKSLKEEGISLLIVEQNAKKAIEIADRTYLLEDGCIALEGSSEMLAHKKIKEVYLGGRY